MRVDGQENVRSPAANPGNRPGSNAPYPWLSYLVRGMIAAVVMGLWGIFLVACVFLVQPDTDRASGILMVLSVPVLLVSALPLVYRYWVKNWQSI